MENFFFLFPISNWKKKMLYNIHGDLASSEAVSPSHIPFAGQLSVERFVNVIWQSKLNPTANFQTTLDSYSLHLWSRADRIGEKKTVYSPRFYYRQCQYENKTGNLHFSELVFQVACKLWHMWSHQFNWALAILSITYECLNPRS